MIGVWVAAVFEVGVFVVTWFGLCWAGRHGGPEPEEPPDGRARFGLAA